MQTSAYIAYGPTLQDHGYGTSASHDVSICAPAFARAKRHVYSLATWVR